MTSFLRRGTILVTTIVTSAFLGFGIAQQSAAPTSMQEAGFVVVPRLLTPTQAPSAMPAPTLAPSPTLTPEPTLAPAPTLTPESALTPSPTLTPEPTLAPDPTLTPEPTLAPDPTLTPEPTLAPDPTLTPEPTLAPAPELTLAPTLTPAPEPVAPTNPAPTVLQTTQTANLRAQPGIGGAFIRTITDGTQVELIGETAALPDGGVWAKVRVNETEGWINSRFLR